MPFREAQVKYHWELREQVLVMHAETADLGTLQGQLRIPNGARVSGDGFHLVACSGSTRLGHSAGTARRGEVVFLRPSGM